MADRRARATNVATSEVLAISFVLPCRLGGTRKISAEPLTATTTQCGSADSATPTLEFQRKAQRDAGTRHTERVSGVRSPTVDVDFVIGQTQLLAETSPTAANAEALATSMSLALSSAFLSACSMACAGASDATRLSGPATFPCATISASGVRDSTALLCS